MGNYRLSEKRLAFILPVSLYFLWLGCTDWLNHFWTLIRLGNDLAAANYILFYLCHAAGIMISAFWLFKNRKSSAGKIKLYLVCTTLLTAFFTLAMSFSIGGCLFVSCAASGLSGGFLPVLLSYYAYFMLEGETRGYAIGLSYSLGYLLHFSLFIIIFPQQEGYFLYLKTIIAVTAMLAAAASSLLLPSCRKNLWLAFSEKGKSFVRGVGTNSIKPLITIILIILFVLFSLAFSSQNYAATSAWLNNGLSSLTFTRVFFIFGLLIAGILCDRAGRYVVLSSCFGLLAAGLFAMFGYYSGPTGFIFFSCVQLSSAFFSVFAWYTFIDLSKYFKSPEIISSLSLSLLFILKQTGLILTDIMAKKFGTDITGSFIFIANLVLIAIAIPLISLFFHLLGNIFVTSVREKSLISNTHRADPSYANPFKSDLEYYFIENKGHTLSETTDKTDASNSAMATSALKKASDQLTQSAEAESISVENNIIQTKNTVNEHLRLLSEKYGLSKRGIQVLELTLNGYLITEIAQNMGISERTVKYHIAQNLKRTGVKTQKQILSMMINNKSFYD